MVVRGAGLHKRALGRKAKTTAEITRQVFCLGSGLQLVVVVWDQGRDVAEGFRRPASKAGSPFHASREQLSRDFPCRTRASGNCLVLLGAPVRCHDSRLLRGNVDLAGRSLA